MASVQDRFSAGAYANDGKHHILLAATGSVATIKLPLIAAHLGASSQVSVRILMTSSAAEFLQSQSQEQPALSSLLSLPGVDGIYGDSDEWSKPWVRGDKILHIELRRWAHIMVVAPLSANSLAKIANGFSDGLLMSVIRAWDTTGLVDGVDGRGRKKRVFLAPAMNTAMWHHPVTSKQIRVLEEDWGIISTDDEVNEANGWIQVLRPMEKELACGDIGDGAMMDWRQIAEHVEKYLSLEPEKVNNAGA